MKLDAALLGGAAGAADAAVALEAAGFDGAYTFEGPSDPFLPVAVAAPATSRIELMTAIAVAFARNPMNLAYLGHDLQQLSQGRFIMGLGTQIRAHVERRFSMPWGQPVARMREMVAAIRAIWDCWHTGSALNFEGEFYQHTLMTPIFVPPATELPPPPIYLAGVGPKMTEMAAEIADGYIVHPFNSAKSLHELSLAAVERGLQKAGRPRSALNVSVQVITATGSSEESLASAVSAARGQIGFYASTPAYAPVLACHGWEALHEEARRLTRENRWAELVDLVDDDVLNTLAVVGEPQVVAQQLWQRFGDVAQRVSPVVYNTDTEVLKALREACAAVGSDQ